MDFVSGLYSNFFKIIKSDCLNIIQSSKLRILSFMKIYVNTHIKSQFTLSLCTIQDINQPCNDFIINKKINNQ